MAKRTFLGCVAAVRVKHKLGNTILYHRASCLLNREAIWKEITRSQTNLVNESLPLDWSTTIRSFQLTQSMTSKAHLPAFRPVQAVSDLFATQEGVWVARFGKRILRQTAKRSISLTTDVLLHFIYVLMNAKVMKAIQAFRRNPSNRQKITRSTNHQLGKILFRKPPQPHCCLVTEF